MKYWLTVGRFQPLHDGHEALIRKKLAENKRVFILIRETDISKKNPYSYLQRVDMFTQRFYEEMRKGKLIVSPVPDIEGIFWGRNVGYKTEQVKLDHEIEQISGTKIREEASKHHKFDEEIYEKPVEVILSKYKDTEIPEGNTDY